MQSPQPPKQNNQKAKGPPVIISATPCTLPGSIVLQPMQDVIAQLVISTIAFSSSNSPSSGGRKGQPTIMMSFIREQIDIRLNDIMLELSKQLADIAEPMAHNEI